MDDFELIFFKQFYKKYFNNYKDYEIKKIVNENSSLIKNKKELLDISNFDFEFYKNNNSDIENIITIQEYFDHWINIGIHENRIYVFDYKYYKENYEDLKNKDINEEVLLAHWFLIGRMEGRICCNLKLYIIDDLEDKIKEEELKSLKTKKEEIDNIVIDNKKKICEIENNMVKLFNQYYENEYTKKKLYNETIQKQQEQYNLYLILENSKCKEELNEKNKLKINNEYNLLEEENKKISLELNNIQKILKLKKIELIKSLLLKCDIENSNDKLKIQNKIEDEKNKISNKYIENKKIEIETKKLNLIDLELKNRIYLYERQYIQNENNNIQFEEKDTLQLKEKILENIHKSLQDITEDKTISNFNDLHLQLLKSNKKKMQSELIELALQKIEEHKLLINTNVSELNYNIQENILQMNDLQINNKQYILENMDMFKLELEKEVDKINLSIGLMELNKKNLITKNDVLILENIEKNLTDKKFYDLKGEKEFLELELQINEFEKKYRRERVELEELKKKEYKIKNDNIYYEINELKLNLEKNDLFMKNKKLEMDNKLAEIEIEKNKCIHEYQKMTLKMIEEKNIKIDEYIYQSKDIKINLKNKTIELDKLKLEELKENNLIEEKNSKLNLKRKKNLEYDLDNKILEIEIEKQNYEKEIIKQEYEYKKKINQNLMDNLDNTSYKTKIENSTIECINKLNDFEEKYKINIEEIYNIKIEEYKEKWNEKEKELNKNIDTFTNDIMIDDIDFKKQHEQYLNLFSRHSEKEIIQLEKDILDMNIKMNESNNKLKEENIKEKKIYNEELELKKKEIELELNKYELEAEEIIFDNLKLENNLIKDKIQYQITETQIKILSDNKLIDKYLKDRNEIFTLNENILNKNKNEKMIYISLEKLIVDYKNIIEKSKKENEDYKNVKFIIEFQENIIKDKNFEVNQSKLLNEEYQKTIQEYNKLYKNKKIKLEEKIGNLLNEKNSKNIISNQLLLTNEKYNNFFTIRNSFEGLFNIYPNLFHKQILGLKTYSIYYELIHFILPKKKTIAHIHCFNLDLFEEYFGHYINLLKKYFSIVVTYIIGDSKKINKYDLCLLKIRNKGMDIGGKIILLYFLNSNNIKYDMIFFIHSKTDTIKRNSYLEPFLSSDSNLSKILFQLKNNTDLGAIFSNNYHCLSKHKKEYESLQKNNLLYLNELSKLLNIEINNPVLFEGNIFIMKKEILETLQPYLELIYSLLNDEYSFDFNWFKIFYKLNSNINMKSAYKLFQDGKKVGNNIPFMLTNNLNTMPDGMIEHTIERIWDGLLKANNKKYIII